MRQVLLGYSDYTLLVKPIHLFLMCCVLRPRTSVNSFWATWLRAARNSLHSLGKWFWINFSLLYAQKPLYHCQYSSHRPKVSYMASMWVATHKLRSWTIDYKNIILSHPHNWIVKCYEERKLWISTAPSMEVV